MLIKQYKLHFTNELSALYDLGEVESFFYLILEYYQKLKRIDLALNPELTFSESNIKTWNVILEQLKQEIPIQYILGNTCFYGLDFEVDYNVLIPRPETEELVDWIIQSQKSEVGSAKSRILDIGTGSGCIAIALAKNIKNASVFALDVSQNALTMAEKNAKKNQVLIRFIQQNILETDNLNQQFDIIVSNPPYVRNLEKSAIKKNVLNNEPHLALFVDDHDPLLFYRKIAFLAKKNLSQNGKLYFEINQYLGKETANLMDELGFKCIELRKDIYGNQRMICAKKDE